jgi:Uncharacterised nucleotidyltransferase
MMNVPGATIHTMEDPETVRAVVGPAGERARPFLLLSHCLSCRSSTDWLERLRGELRNRSSDAKRLAAETDAHFLGPALFITLRHKHLEEAISSEFLQYLSVVHFLNIRRNTTIHAQMVEITRILNLIGIDHIVLKGGTHLLDDLFGDLGFRMLRDLDLLIPETRLMDAVGLLLEHGYKIHGKGEPWTYQFRMMYREGDLVVVELHRHVGEQRHLLSPEEAFRHAVPLSAPSEPRVLSLCPTHRVLHSIFHAEI